MGVIGGKVATRALQQAACSRQTRLPWRNIHMLRDKRHASSNSSGTWGQTQASRGRGPLGTERKRQKRKSGTRSRWMRRMRSERREGESGDGRHERAAI